MSEAYALHDPTEYPTPGEGYWYMAGPYSDDPAERYKQHLKIAAILTRAKLTIYSPIVQFHDMAHTYNMPTTADFWQEHNYNMILPSHGVILACMSNWATSKGVRNELAFCKLKSKPVWALDIPDYHGDELHLVWTRMV